MSAVVLRLFTGPHMGAELELEAGEYVLGSSLDCDIILHDSSVAPRHIKLLVEENPASVRVIPLKGNALVAGDPLVANAELSPRTPCFVGLTCFAWASSGVPASVENAVASDDEAAPSALPDLRAAWDEVESALRPILHPAPAEALAPPPLADESTTQSAPEDTAPEEQASDVAADTSEDTDSLPAGNIILKVDGSTANNAVLNRLPEISARRTEKHWVWRAITFGVLLLALSGLVFKTHDELNKPMQSIKNIQDILDQAGFSTLEVVDSDKGPVISGRLADDTERGRLVRLVQRMHLPVYLEVRVDGDMTQALLTAFNSRELFPKVWSERDGEHIRLHVSGYMKDGVVEAWAFAGAKEDLPWLGSFLQEGTEPAPGTLIRSIPHAEDVDIVLRPALEAARLEKAQITYLPGTVDIFGVFDVDARNRLDRVLVEIRDRLGVPIVFQIREDLPQLPQPMAGKSTGIHPDKASATQMPATQADAASPAPQRLPSAFRVTGVTMSPMRFITLESGERIFEGGLLPGGHTLETISQTRLTLRRDGHTTTFKLRDSDEH